MVSKFKINLPLRDVILYLRMVRFYNNSERILDSHGAKGVESAVEHYIAIQ